MSELRLIEDEEGDLEIGVSDKDSFDYSIQQDQEINPFNIARESLEENEDKLVGYTVYTSITGAILFTTGFLAYRTPELIDMIKGLN